MLVGEQLRLCQEWMNSGFEDHIEFVDDPESYLYLFDRNLDRDIENNSKRWRKFVEAEAPEKEKFPQVFNSRNFFHLLHIIFIL